MSTMLDVTEQRKGDAAILVLQGRLDATTSPEAERHLNRLIDAGDCLIVVDLSDLEYISSAGLRVLLAGLKRLKQCEGAMKLTALRPEIQKVFDIAGFNRLFSISPTIDEAIGPESVK